jgi:hypothetical protein
MKSLKLSKGRSQQDLFYRLILVLFFGPLYFLLGEPLIDWIELEHLSFNGCDPDAVVAILTKGNDYYFKSGRHPLILIYNPIGQLLTLITKSHGMSALLMTVAAGIITQLLFFSYLRKCDLSSLRAFLFTFLLGSSFSHLLFGAIPESFIFTAASIIGLLLINISIKEDKRFYAAFLPASILAFGMSMTNLIPITLILFNRFYKRRGFTFCVKATSVITGIVILSTTILAGIQTMTYGSTYFLDIHDGHFSGAIELLSFPIVDDTFTSLHVYVPNLFLNNMIGPHSYTLEIHNYVCYYTGDHPVILPAYFTAQPNTRLLAIFGYLGLLALTLFNGLRKSIFRNGQFKLLGAYYAYCFVFHNVFDPSESIVHSNLYTFPLVGMMALSFSSSTNRKQNLGETIILCLVVSVILLSNLTAVNEILALLGEEISFMPL